MSRFRAQTSGFGTKAGSSLGKGLSGWAGGSSVAGTSSAQTSGFRIGTKLGSSLGKRLSGWAGGSSVAGTSSAQTTGFGTKAGSRFGGATGGTVGGSPQTTGFGTNAVSSFGKGFKPSVGRGLGRSGGSAGQRLQGDGGKVGLSSAWAARAAPAAAASGTGGGGPSGRRGVDAAGPSVSRFGRKSVERSGRTAPTATGMAVPPASSDSGPSKDRPTFQWRGSGAAMRLAAAGDTAGRGARRGVGGGMHWAAPSASRWGGPGELSSGGASSAEPDGGGGLEGRVAAIGRALQIEASAAAAILAEACALLGLPPGGTATAQVEAIEAVLGPEME
mmetsp:Transcript_12570/g.37706  ORF Transcript_12570/g.37706 Transcript_12570/m.37706 type:complete len:332 (-) Transcript_12570:65-1060(-)